MRSTKQKEYVKESPELKMCRKEESQGRILAVSCKKARHEAASLDKLSAKLYLPIEVAHSKIIQLTTEAAKIAFMPYLSLRPMETRESGKHIEYEIEAEVNGMGQLLFGKIEGNGEEADLHNIRLGKYFTRVLPICTKESLATLVLQKLTTFSTPSSCVIESGKVVTFDKMNYTYPLNNCEHVVFADLAVKPRILISIKKNPQKQHIMMIVDGHKFEVELNKESRFSRGSIVTIKIDGQPKELISTLEHLETLVTKYMDGVVTIYSLKYGVEVIADGERLEVLSYPIIFRDKVTGLCGDLNGEWIADLKSPKQCIMPIPKLTAMTFMLEDGKCTGIPKQARSEMQKFEHKCIEKKDIPTKVTEVFETHTVLKGKSGESELKHIFEEYGEKICVTKEMVRICYKTYPKEIVPKKVPFTCFSGPKAEVIKRRIIAGEHIEDLSTHPTEFIQTIYESKQC